MTVQVQTIQIIFKISRIYEKTKTYKIYFGRTQTESTTVDDDYFVLEAKGLLIIWIGLQSNINLIKNLSF